MNWRTRLSTLSLGAILLASCNNNAAPDVSSIQVPLKSNNFYTDFSKIDTLKISEELNELKSKYPDFIHFYLDTLAVGLSNNPEFTNNLESVKIFLTNKDYKGLIDTVNAVFPTTDKITAAIQKALQYAKHYDNKLQLPSNLYYVVTGLNDYTAVTRGDKDLAIGLDYALGQQYQPYFAIGTSDFMTIKFTPEYLPIWAMIAMYNNNYISQHPNGSFIELAIEKGKQVYYLTKVFPNYKLETIMGYTPEQMKWADDNQAQAYNFFKEQEIIFDKSLQQSMRYLNEGPFSPGMPQESPGNIGTYLGYKIVEAYANKSNKELIEILNEKDNLKIFNQSKYKP